MESLIGDKIRRIRNIKGYSQEYMADQLEISQRSYSKLERGEIKLDWNRINDISQILKTDPIELVNNDYILAFTNCNQSGYINTNHNNFPNELKEMYDLLIKEKDKRIALLELQLQGRD